LPEAEQAAPEDDLLPLEVGSKGFDRTKALTVVVSSNFSMTNSRSTPYSSMSPTLSLLSTESVESVGQDNIDQSMLGQVLNVG
jgi:hypothetical protein